MASESAGIIKMSALDLLGNIPEATDADLADWLELCGKDENLGALRIYRVAAHYARRLAEAERLLDDLIEWGDVGDICDPIGKRLESLGGTDG